MKKITKIRNKLKKAYKARKGNSITSAQDLIIYYRECGQLK